MGRLGWQKKGKERKGKERKEKERKDELAQWPGGEGGAMSLLLLFYVNAK